MVWRSCNFRHFSIESSNGEESLTYRKQKLKANNLEFFEESYEVKVQDNTKQNKSSGVQVTDCKWSKVELARILERAWYSKEGMGFL